MKNNRYFIAYKRFYKQLDDIAEYYRVPKVIFLIHSLYCFIIYGSTPNDYIHYEFYKLRHCERKMYITHRKAVKFEKVFNDPKNAHFFNDKAQFNKKFKKFVKRNWVYIPEINENEFITFVKNNKSVILKPIDLSSGRGITIYNYKNDESAKETYNELQGEKILVEEIVKNCKELQRFNSSSCNTVRIYTMVERDKSVSIINALIRIGAKGSAVDNYHSGGVGAAIDINTGIIYTQLHDVNGKKHIVHPSTGTEIIGKRIPKWEALKQSVKEAAKKLPTSRWIAWDICITEDGFEYIEGNYQGDPGFLQAVDHVGKYYLIKSKK